MLDAAVEAYNAVAADLGWTEAQALTGQRGPRLTRRLIELGGLKGWEIAMAKARASPFLRGETGRDAKHENWRPNLDFFLREERLRDLMEGKYDRKSPANGASVNGSGNSGGILERIAEAAAFAVAAGPDG